MLPRLSDARAALRALADPARAKSALGFFKTGPGEYGEGDQFLGISVPSLRKVARAHRTLPLADLATLLGSKLHEERLFALFVLVDQFERGDDDARRERFRFYLDHLAGVNNWDLVDSSAAPIVGEHLLATGDTKLLAKLARSKDLWERRVAIVATHAFIRAGRSDVTFAIAEQLMSDEHDLIHKAIGWMLREVGKNVDEHTLRGFLRKHAARLPRTALRYAIERFPPDERKGWLAR